MAFRLDYLSYFYCYYCYNLGLLVRLFILVMNLFLYLTLIILCFYWLRRGLLSILVLSLYICYLVFSWFYFYRMKKWSNWLVLAVESKWSWTLPSNWFNFFFSVRNHWSSLFLDHIRCSTSSNLLVLPDYNLLISICRSILLVYLIIFRYNYNK